ncbi:MAG: PEP-CTERM sorting domain-containing protein [Acidobacteriota bacterium]|nr:PEP-CTERM sorting domain-containing protein [Acidobacteriota bacterium]
MKQLARFAVLGAAFVAAVPFASAATLIYGKINTAGAATFTYPPQTFTVSSSGAATLDLVTPGSTTGSTTGVVTGPAATGTLASFYPSGTVTDYSFSTSTISAATPTLILSITSGADTLQFYATSTGAYTATSLPSTEGALVLYGYLSDVGPNYTTNQAAQLDIAANGIGNNFTEDLTAPTPEPSSLMLLGTGLLSAGGVMFRRRKA